jgi:nicotinamide-nucleotide amidase
VLGCIESSEWNRQPLVGFGIAIVRFPAWFFQHRRLSDPQPSAKITPMTKDTHSSHTVSSHELAQLAVRVGECLRARGWRLATAESCTGGWVAKTITDIAGSSDWFDRGFVTYSNAAKQDMLGVATELIEDHGAVSAPVVQAMVAGALAHSQAEVALAVSGIAGPGGGSPEKPVGTVWFAWGRTGRRSVTRRECFAGDREAVRVQAVRTALFGLLEALNAPDTLDADG